MIKLKQPMKYLVTLSVHTEAKGPIGALSQQEPWTGWHLDKSSREEMK